MKFYLGIHNPAWGNNLQIPYMVSVRIVLRRKKPLNGDWILDSGGFSELSLHGKYTISENDYVSCVKRLKPTWAVCQDWMCEKHIINKTGLSIKEHQERTLESYLLLNSFSNKIRPVLQGWTSEDYVNHLTMYKKANVKLNQLFGVGSICSRNGQIKTVFNILKNILNENKIPLHAFGIKSKTLVYCDKLLWSADSMAWSTDGRFTTS